MESNQRVALKLEDSCVYCGEKAVEPVFSCVDTRENPWRWGVCRECGTYSLLPKPTEADLKLAYDVDYYGGADAKFEGLSERFLAKCRRRRARRMASYLSSKNGRACILDVGCGNGEFLGALSTLGDYELWGTELEGPASKRASRHPGVSLKIGLLRKDSFEENSFDMITLFHVFEHLPNPHETLQWLHEFLRPGGMLVISFPNIASCQARFFREHWLHLDPPRHLFMMPPESFENAASAVGFELKRRSYFSIEQNPYGMIQSLLNKMGYPRDFLYERLKGNAGYAAEIGTGCLLWQKLLAGLFMPIAVVFDLTDSYLLKRGATVEYILTKRHQVGK